MVHSFTFFFSIGLSSCILVSNHPFNFHFHSHGNIFQNMGQRIELPCLNPRLPLQYMKVKSHPHPIVVYYLLTLNYRSGTSHDIYRVSLHAIVPYHFGSFQKNSKTTNLWVAQKFQFKPQHVHFSKPSHFSSSMVIPCTLRPLPSPSYIHNDTITYNQILL